MNYEKKYKEALKRAKDMLSYKEVRCEDMEYLFPELAESEDERIRKSLIILLQHFCKGYRVPGLDLPVSYKDMLAWLEKQGGQILANSCKTCKDEQKPAWSERDEYRYNACLQYFEEIKPDSVYYKDYLWLKSLKERIKQ